ncbi:MAG: hypothetical protein HY920_02010 [Elusimicrobia bacterium]|nr:hypothetical protein [Elusimicrobiota bacterium]
MILMEGALGFPAGNILDLEEKGFEMQVSYQNGEIKTARPTHILWNYGLTLEYFSFKRIGIQGGYHFRSISQHMSVGVSGYQNPDNNGTLIDFANPFFGLTYHFYKVKRGNFYALGRMGAVLDGKLYPLPAANDYYGNKQMSYKLSGYNYGLGTGYCVYPGRFALGVLFLYTNHVFHTQEKIYTSMDKTFSVSSFDLIMNIGINFK